MSPSPTIGEVPGNKELPNYAAMAAVAVRNRKRKVPDVDAEDVDNTSPALPPPDAPSWCTQDLKLLATSCNCTDEEIAEINDGALATWVVDPLD